MSSYTCIREGPDGAQRFRAKVSFNGETYESPNYCTTSRQEEHSAVEVAFNELACEGPDSLVSRILRSIESAYGALISTDLISNLHV
ncbi:hypothetical protein SSX86_024204 [Deinandra increscens subsp. villosa]|uniref:Uncharacterized protein n=1 Tax=Deinandra increscens subsp. villosa TaxID=3103831 RepID=A0AAP0CMN3_9ASTR